VKQILAALLMASLSFPLALAFTPADADSTLPACCRRDGKHACGMLKSQRDAAAGGPVVRASKTPCAQFPADDAGLVKSRVSVLPGKALVLAAPRVSLAAVRYHEVLRPLAIARPGQERGPPAGPQA